MPPLVSFTTGGMIGLFTGLSLVSFVEIVYWIYRATFSCRMFNEDEDDYYDQENHTHNGLKIVRQTKVGTQTPPVSDVFVE